MNRFIKRQIVLFGFLVATGSIQAIKNKNISEAIFQKVGSIDERTTRMLPTINSVQANTANVLDTVQNSPKGFISTFGESIISPVEDIVNVQFRYGVPALETTTQLVGTGTVYADESIGFLESGADANSQAHLQGTRRIRYQPGHEIYAFFTAVFTKNGPQESRQLIGLFDDTDGFAVGYNADQFSIMSRRNGVSTFVPKSQFNRDTLDGNGSSGFTLDTENMNVFKISLGWLGAAPIKYYVLREDGKWILFHVIEHPNSSPTTSAEHPTLPVHAEVITGSTGQNLQLSTASWSGGIVGVTSPVTSHFFSKSQITTISWGNVETHVMTLRNKTMYQGVQNFIEVHIRCIGGGATDYNNSINIFRLRKGATVDALVFSDVDAQNSVMDFSSAGKYDAGTGTEVILVGSNTFGSGPTMSFIPSDFIINLFPGESITLTVESLGTASSSAIGSLSWQELF